METSDTSLVRGNQTKGERRRGEKSKDCERVVEMPNTSLVRQPTPG